MTTIENPISPTAPGPPAGRPAARLWEVDVARTVAIVMMVIYHIAFDVRFLVPDVSLDPYNGGWRALQVVTASTFLGLVGVSAWIRSERLRARGVSGVAAWRLGAPRGALIVAGGGAVSLVTYLFLGSDDMVRFGILQLIAVAYFIVLPPLVRFGPWNAVLGAVIVAVGLVLKGTLTDTPVLLVIGLDPGQTGVDWFPMLPWIGVPLIGVALGAVLYPRGGRGSILGGLKAAPPWAGAAGAPGRNSLAVYLIHQPVLIALISGGLLLFGMPVDGL